MSSVGLDHPTWLDARSWRRLAKRLDSALQAARSSGRPRLVSVTARCADGIDPVAVVVASRAPGEPWFAFEQPDRDAGALGTLGTVLDLPLAPGTANPISELSRRWRELVAGGSLDEPAAVPGSGPVAVGGLPFDPTAGLDRGWSALGPAGLSVPALSLARSGAQCWLTVNALVAGDDTAEGVLVAIEHRLAALRVAPLPLFDPAPAGAPVVRSVMPPAHYEEAVARAVQRIRAGELEKIVLAREVEVAAGADHDPGALFGVLRDAFASCFVYAVGRGATTFIGASPELLARREGARASTVALAGSTRRSADPAVDDHLGERLLRSDKDREENLIVARRIVRALRPHAVWVTAAPEPALVRVANIQHLGLPIRAQLAHPLAALELAALLHPTPAVGGEPWPQARPLIPALEGFDRGLYAAPLGWTDASGDGEFCVALRCALLSGPRARLFAGAGIVRDSDPAQELAETEVKLQALLPLLAA
ncbi:MAG TPA: isochorismate synthase [Solirubrobacteraceae bacterium]|nr:isochorismate synthase [Solirubrobacteraceae bacterium]